ncbi:MAG: HTH-type transcriptional repressor CytR [Tenericutes bacterium ADurb.Bin239]|jgi:LacI family transcriptional regulator|nr:MAG: HTH-type transcriptional repressor CytR [Tenericutes bacterium ADurb.Bin239]
MKKITLKHIAEKMNVSAVAVHKALNNQKGVSEELRKKIKAYAASVGYGVKSPKQVMNNKRFIFVINKDFFLTPSEQYYSNIFYYLSGELSKVNSMLQVVFVTEVNPVDSLKSALNGLKPDGIFFAGELNNDVFRYMENINIPSLFIDYYTPLYALNFMYNNNYQTAYKLTNYLIEKGHRKIGFIGNIQKTAAISDRYFGYLKAITENEFRFDPKWHINENIELSQVLFDLPLNDMPTVFVCHCDAAAQKLYSMLSFNGLKIPEDVSVVSFDNTQLCDNLLPKLTSIGPARDSFAKKAYSAMIDIMNKKRVTHQISVILAERDSVKTIVRQS